MKREEAFKKFACLACILLGEHSDCDCVMERTWSKICSCKTVIYAAHTDISCVCHNCSKEVSINDQKIMTDNDFDSLLDNI